MPAVGKSCLGQVGLCLPGVDGEKTGRWQQLLRNQQENQIQCGWNNQDLWSSVLLVNRRVPSPEGAGLPPVCVAGKRGGVGGGGRVSGKDLRTSDG